MEILNSRPDILDVVENVAKSQGLKNQKISDVETNAKGEGFLGDIMMVKVKDDQVDKELNLIIKSAFQSDEIRDFIPVRVAFENETYFYTKVYTTFRKFENTKEVAKSAELVPKCYEVCLNNQSELLVLENLKSLGFECFDKKALLDHNHVKMIFETYGKYHAYSFAYKDQHPEKYQQLASNTQDVFGEMMENQMFFDTMSGTINLVKSFLMPGEDDEILSKFGKYEGRKVLDTFCKATTADCDCSVIIHGDCWSNNMMFKYEIINGNKKPVDIRLIDWQLIKLGSPVCDLSYFLYSGASKDSKDILDNLDDYLQIYYSSLSTSVKQLGSDPEKVFPFKVLKEHWKQYSKYGIIMAFMVMRMKLTHKEEIVDLHDVKNQMKEDENNSEGTMNKFLSSGYSEDLFRKRMRDLLTHTSEIDCL